MLIYHGSNVKVEKPMLLDGQRALDFGAGFYLTSSLEQAVRWAKSVTRRRGNGHPTANTYELNEQLLAGLSLLRFDTANGDWLDYVVQNRRGYAVAGDFDLVIGPVANDSTLPVMMTIWRESTLRRKPSGDCFHKTSPTNTHLRP